MLKHCAAVILVVSVFNPLRIHAETAEAKISPETTQAKEVKPGDTIVLSAVPSNYSPENPSEAPCPPWGEPTTEYTWYVGNLAIDGDTSSSTLKVKCDSPQEAQVSVKIKQTWTDESGNTSTTERTSSNVRVAAVRVTFVSLVATKLLDFGMRAGESPGTFVLGGATTHEGIVKVEPNSARDLVSLRLFQHKNTLVQIPNTNQANVPAQGADADYNNYSGGPGSNDGADNKKITCNDYPKVGGTSNYWSNVPPETAKMNMNFNLYLQYSVGEAEMKTIGKVGWSIHGDCIFNNGVPVTSGSTTGGNGSQSSESPQDPASHNP